MKYCKQCGNAMWMAPIVLTSNPPQYQFHCPNCKKIFYSFTCDNELLIQNYKQWQQIEDWWDKYNGK